MTVDGGADPDQIPTVHYASMMSWLLGPYQYADGWGAYMRSLLMIEVQPSPPTQTPPTTTRTTTTPIITPTQIPTPHLHLKQQQQQQQQHAEASGGDSV